MSFHEFIEALPSWLVFLFVLVNMFGLGLSLTVTEILTPLKSRSIVIKTLLLNFILIPAIAYGLARALQLEHSRQIMFILLACSAGDPFTTKLTQAAKGDKAFSLAIMAMLSVGTIIFMPILLPILLPGVSVNPIEIIKPLVLLILLPLIIGLILKVKWSSFASKWAPRLDRLGSIIVVTAVGLFAIEHIPDIISSFGTHILGACILLVLIGFGLGYLLGGSDRLHKGDLAINTAYRGASAALAVGIKNFPGNQDIFIVGIIMVLIATLIVLPLSSAWLRKRNITSMPISNT
jgi:predicted Na+-dependent transporter